MAAPATPPRPPEAAPVRPGSAPLPPPAFGPTGLGTSALRIVPKPAATRPPEAEPPKRGTE
ncbi:hypothetical protein ACWEOE_27190 [Amycolatopsis sp. NPDC004368]